MNVLIVVSSLATTGPGFVVENFLKIAAGTEYESLGIVIATIKDVDANMEIEIPSNVEVFRLGDGKQSLSVSAKRLSELVKERKIDLVFSHGLKSDIISWFTKSQRTLLHVSTSHNNPFEDYTLLYGVKGMIMALMQMVTFRKMDKVITLNPELYRVHSKWIGKQKTELIPNGVAPVAANNREHKKRSIPVFGIVGVYNKRKNQDIILNEFNSEEDTDRRLVVWGNGFEQWQPKRECHSIVMKGFSDDKSNIFSSFDVLISMSKSEGLPLNILEGISAGKALILSDIPAHRFIAQFVPSEYVRLVSNETELKRAIDSFSTEKEWMNNVKSVMQDVFEEHFSAKIMVEKYVETFRRLYELKAK